MSESTRVACTHCGYAGTVAKEIREGQAVRCPKCKGMFAHTTEAFEAVAPGPGLSPVVDAPALEPWEAKIDGRIAKLESANRRLTIACAALALLALASLWVAAVRGTPASPGAGSGRLAVDSIVASRAFVGRLDLVDDEGRSLATLQQHGNRHGYAGWAALDIKSGRGAELATITSSGVQLVDAGGRTRASLYSGIAAVADSGLILKDNNGDTRVSISCLAGPSMNFNDPGDRTRLRMGLNGSKTTLEYRPAGEGKFTSLAE